MMLVKESITNFERGVEPKDALGLGIEGTRAAAEKVYYELKEMGIRRITFEERRLGNDKLFWIIKIDAPKGPDTGFQIQHFESKLWRFNGFSDTNYETIIEAFYIAYSRSLIASNNSLKKLMNRQTTILNNIDRKNESS